MGGNKEQRFLHLVNWDEVMLDGRRGQGIRNLKIDNNSLLMKWLWRYRKGAGELMEKTYIQLADLVNSSHVLGL